MPFVPRTAAWEIPGEVFCQVEAQNQKRYLRCYSSAGVAWSQQTGNKFEKAHRHTAGIAHLTRLEREPRSPRLSGNPSFGFTPSFPIASFLHGRPKYSGRNLGTPLSDANLAHLFRQQSTTTRTTLASPRSPPRVREPQIHASEAPAGASAICLQPHHTRDSSSRSCGLKKRTQDY